MSNNLFSIRFDDDGVYTTELTEMPTPLRVGGAIEMFGSALEVLRREKAITEEQEQSIADLFHASIEKYAKECGFLEEIE